MKICIDGLSLDQYHKSSFMEEFNLFLENQQFIDYNESDDLIVPLIDETDIAMEDNMVWDIVKGGYRVTKGAIKMGAKGYQAANRQWGNVKNRWADIKPRILKLVREFGQSLQNLWHKFMKYDEKYKELGQKIQQVIQFSINSLTELPPVTFNYHIFNVDILLAILDYIKSYDVFFNEIFDSKIGIVDNNSKLGLGKADGAYQTARDAIAKNDKDTLNAICQELSQVIANLSDGGDATIIRKFMTAKGWAGKFLWMNYSSDNILNQTSRERSDKNNISASEYVKAVILGEAVTKSYTSQNLQEFKNDMVGNNGFLKLVASMVNNNVLSGALKSSGGSIKKETDKMMKYFNDLMQQAQQLAAKDLSAKQQAQQQNNPEANLKTNSAQTTAERNATKNGLDGTGMKAQAPEFASLSGDGDIPDEAGTMTADKLAELYVRNMTILFTKVAATYQMIIKGMLAATYEIISEADQITYTIDKQTSYQKGQVK